MNNALQLFSEIKQTGELIVSLRDVAVPEPAAGQVVVRMLAAPINPSDMWPLFGPAELREAKLSADGLTLRAPVLQSWVGAMKSRWNQALPVGNEGAGVVEKAGAGAEHLLGKTVAVMSGACYAQYCCVPMHSCLPHEAGVTAREAAASFVNPLTALGMVETMRMEGHKALVHTAAASNLGQMLNRICQEDKVPLVNVVRKPEQAELLKAQGAVYVVDSSRESYRKDLYAAIAATGATLAFDATGGGELASDILATMEAYLSRDAQGLNTYGSDALKQVYLYGALDISPTVLRRAYGMSWAVGGWLLPRFIAKVGMARAAELQQRVAKSIKTTFASQFTEQISLRDMLKPEVIGRYTAKKTGTKFLVNPEV
ncbi:zinc-binding dehydrogenase [Simiduia litorea]|uniref:zinc-binding dehydrogenase n=1 Tax=Simiduia litorea TaxID=1435348 RepID=UPI0036F24992